MKSVKIRIFAGKMLTGVMIWNWWLSSGHNGFFMLGFSSAG